MNPYKTLSQFIKANIYSKMKKKDVAKILGHSMGGSLIDAIEDYRKAMFKTDCDKMKKEYEWRIKCLQDKIDNPNRLSSEDVYPEGSKFE